LAQLISAFVPVLINHNLTIAELPTTDVYIPVLITLELQLSLPNLALLMASSVVSTMTSWKTASRAARVFVE
jgi:hypothetical protein